MRHRTNSRRWPAALTALALAATAITVAAPASAAPADVTAGHVEWGVRTTFRNYIVSPIAHGTITTNAPATQAEGNGAFTFPIADGSYDDDTGATSVATDGSVHFFGHGGILDVLVSDVRVVIDGTDAHVVADVTSKEFIDTTTEGPVTVYDDVALVALDLTGVTPTATGNTVTYANVPSTLTEEGAPAFGGFYPAGDAFDPVTFTLELDEATDPGDPDPGDSTLTWRVSQQAWTANNLSQSHDAGDGAIKGDDGFVFPAASIAFDPETGATSAAFDGYLQLGNTSQGGYRIRFADPVFTIGEDGTGSLVADVEYCTGDCDDPPANWTSVSGVTLGELDVDPASPVDGVVSITVTPDFPLQGDPANPARAQFHPSLIGSITDDPPWSSGALAPSLAGHFRQTGAGSDALKAPAPITVTFPFELDEEPGETSGTIDIITTVDGGGLTLSVLDDQVVLPTPVLNTDGTWLETSGQLPEVTVTDLRSTDPGWSVNAQLTDFVGDAGGFDGSSLGWAPRVVSSTASGAAPGNAVSPNTSGIDGGSLGSAGSGDGRGTTIFGADLDLQIPTETDPGTYTAVLTLTAI